MSHGSAFSRNEVALMVVRVSLVSAFTYFSIKWFLNQLDPTSKNKKKAVAKAQEQLRRISLDNNHTGLSQLTDYEVIIASHLVVPEDITVSWSDVAGLDSLIKDLRETVFLPIKRRDLFANSRLTQPPKGILLYGPPGCGKTLIAKATAKEAGTRFINLDIAMLVDKWYGESQKLTAAVFSLAVKLQPCIIFIDEIDSLLRSRNRNDHEATAMMKAQFMSLWDGLITDPNCTVIVMGATNRPHDLDAAIQRRMPATFHVSMPNAKQRERILQVILSKEPIAPEVDLKHLSERTDGFSGADLHELCRQACVYRIRDFIDVQDTITDQTVAVPKEKPSTSGADSDDEYHDALRPITMEDLLMSHDALKESKRHCSNAFPGLS